MLKKIMFMLSVACIGHLEAQENDQENFSIVQTNFQKGLRAYVGDGSNLTFDNWRHISSVTGSASRPLFPIQQDLQAALYYFNRGVEEGDTQSMNMLGKMYLEGKGVSQNREIAKELFSCAVVKGDALGKNNLAWVHRMEENIYKAISLYEDAASQGLAVARTNLGMLYLEGRGVEKNIQQASHFFTQAANQGDPVAQYNLAFMYGCGLLPERTISDAIELYKKAEAQGHPEARAAIIGLRNRNVGK